jgi:hypothetical protein
MSRIFVFEIKHTPELYPANLGFIFADGDYYAKVAICNPADRENPTFKIGFRLDAEDGADLYIAGQKCIGKWTSDFHHIQKQSKDFAMTFVDWKQELSQDLRAVGYKAEEFPELKDYL